MSSSNESIERCLECGGEMYFPPVKNCSCHINPPCSACLDNTEECCECGWSVPDDSRPFGTLYNGVQKITNGEGLHFVLIYLEPAVDGDGLEVRMASNMQASDVPGLLTKVCTEFTADISSKN